MYVGGRRKKFVVEKFHPEPKYSGALNARNFNLVILINDSCLPIMQWVLIEKSL